MASILSYARNYYNGGWKGYSDGTAHGYAGGSYPYVLRFTTSSFSGNSTQISFTFNLVVSSGTSASSTLKYALATSDTYKDNYRTSPSNPSDSTRFATGSWSVSGLTTGLTGASRTLTISTTGLRGNTTYYLYLWSGNAVTIYGTMVSSSISSTTSAALTQITLPAVGDIIRWSHVKPLYENLNKVCSARGVATVGIPSGTSYAYVFEITQLINHINGRFSRAIPVPGSGAQLTVSLLQRINNEINIINS